MLAPVRASSHGTGAFYQKACQAYHSSWFAARKGRTIGLTDALDQAMKAGESLLGLASAIRGGITCASQAQHPILQQHAKLCSDRTSFVPQLQSLASLATLCRSRNEQSSKISVAPSLQQPSCMPHRTQQQSIRCYQSGAQTAAAPRLKQRLRELMMLVHPDRWSAHPKARQENERSFKLLNEYLEAAKAVSVSIVTIDNVWWTNHRVHSYYHCYRLVLIQSPFPQCCNCMCIWPWISAHVLYSQHVCSTGGCGDAGWHCSTGGRSSVPLCVLLASAAARGAVRR